MLADAAALRVPAFVPFSLVDALDAVPDDEDVAAGHRRHLQGPGVRQGVEGTQRRQLAEEVEPPPKIVDEPTPSRARQYRATPIEEVAAEGRDFLAQDAPDESFRLQTDGPARCDLETPACAVLDGAQDAARRRDHLGTDAFAGQHADDGSARRNRRPPTCPALRPADRGAADA